MAEQTIDIDKYYHSQAAQSHYLEALIRLAKPKQTDVVLDVGTGSGSAALHMANLVRQVIAIDPREKPILENTKLIKELKQKGEIHQAADVRFQVGHAEEIDKEFPAEHFDVVICWGSLHHFSNCNQALQGIYKVCKLQGKLIILDAFFPEAVRDFQTCASWVHDETTVQHYTYWEYQWMLRQSGFQPKVIEPYRHHNNLEKWLSTIEDEQRRAALRDQFFALPYEKKKLITLESSTLKGKWSFWYDTFVMLAEKIEMRRNIHVGQSR